MLKLLRVTQTKFNKLFQLVVTSVSSRNTLTAEEYGPYGNDSRPSKDTTAIYATTIRDGDECIIGYLNNNRKSEIGEHRLFCTDEAGNFKFNVWLRADGTLLMGDSDIPAEYVNYAVMFNELKIEFDKFQQAFNQHVTVYNSHIHPILNALPAATPPGVVTSSPTLSTSTPSTAVIDNAKNIKIKTNP